MKTLPILVATLTLLALGSACTYTTQPKQGHSRVIISAQGPKKASSHGPALHHPAKSLGRSALFRTPPETRARNLSASTDINTITYKVIDLSDNSVYEEGEVDLYYLSIELFLPPGGEFRIIVDVDINDTAPGTNVGVTRYGDQADFVVDDYYDTYVDLTVHPTQALVFDPASVVSGTPTKIQYLDTTKAVPVLTESELYSAALTPGPADKLFYGPNADLYYFNKTANAVYHWTDISKKMGPSDEILSGATSFDALEGYDALDTTVELYAACADPTTAGVLWVVGKDTSDNQWHYYYCDVSGGVPSVYEYSSSDEADEFFDSNLTTDMRGALDVTKTITYVPTGIAVDSTYQDVYITYYAYGTTEVGLAAVESGLLEYYGDTLDAWFPSETAFAGLDTSAIFTDVSWDQGKAWVLSAPNTTIPGAPANTGKANLWLFDEYLNTPYTAPDVSRKYSGDSVAVSASTTQMVLPNRFAGPIQGTSLYFSQGDYRGSSGWSHILSALDLDNDSIASY